MVKFPTFPVGKGLSMCDAWRCPCCDLRSCMITVTVHPGLPGPGVGCSSACPGQSMSPQDARCRASDRPPVSLGGCLKILPVCGLQRCALRLRWSQAWLTGHLRLAGR